MRGVLLVVMACCAAWASMPARAATQFVDLTGGRQEAVVSPSEAAASRFMDLSTGAGTVSPIPQSVAQSAAPDTRSRFVDLAALRHDRRPLPQILDSRSAASPQPARVIGSDPHDPHEEWNRRRYQSHLALHRNLVEPVGRAYTGVVPAPMRRGIHNVLANLKAPTIVTNDVLQGRIPQAIGATARFVVNSTIGIAGIFDVADGWGLPFRDSDFGETLASYGVGDGPFLMIPAFGPTNPRDFAGRIVDVFINPIHYLAVPGGIYTSTAETGMRELDRRTQRLGEIERIEQTAPDPYLTYRDLARSRRHAEIGEGMQTHYVDLR